MLGRRSSQAITATIVILCGLAVWISSKLMEYHSPDKAVVKAAAEEDSFLGGLCRGDDDEGNVCAEVVKGKYGIVKIPWRFLVTETTTDDTGKTVKRQVAKWIDYPVPVAQLGMCYYLFIGVWFVFTGRPVLTSRRWHLIPLLLSCLGVIGSLYFVWVMAFVLKEWCPLCSILHGIDFLLCAAMFLLWPRRAKTAGKAPAAESPIVDTDLGFRHILATVACITAICTLGFVQRHGEIATAVVKRSLEKQKKNMTRFTEEYKRFRKGPRTVAAIYYDAAKVEIPPREDAPVFGNPQAEHEVVLFSDLQCPYCRKFEVRFKKEFMPLWKGQLKLTFRHFPLCKACNPRMSNVHPQACEAAYAAEAAKLQGGNEAYWKMHHLILKHQDEMKKHGFSVKKFEEYAAQIGLDLERFKTDMRSDAVKQRIKEDVAVGTKLGLNSTPTVFLDGRKLVTSIHTQNPVFWKTVAGLHLKNSD